MSIWPHVYHSTAKSPQIWTYLVAESQTPSELLIFPSVYCFTCLTYICRSCRWNPGDFSCIPLSIVSLFLACKFWLSCYSLAASFPRCFVVHQKNFVACVVHHNSQWADPPPPLGGDNDQFCLTDAVPWHNSCFILCCFLSSSYPNYNQLHHSFSVIYWSFGAVFSPHPGPSLTERGYFTG